jgi:hypothetical protein
MLLEDAKGLYEHVIQFALNQHGIRLEAVEDK